MVENDEALNMKRVVAAAGMSARTFQLKEEGQKEKADAADDRNDGLQISSRPLCAPTVGMRIPIAEGQACRPDGAPNAACRETLNSADY